MGYDISIGQRDTEREVCGDEVYEHVIATAPGGAEVGAPRTVSRYNDNTCSLSYGGFSKFLIMLGLSGDDVFGEDDVLELTEHHAQVWEDAAARYELIELDPLWDSYITDDMGNRRRIAFFQFWIRWALDNCDDPVLIVR